MGNDGWANVVTLSNIHKRSLSISRFYLYKNTKLSMEKPLNAFEPHFKIRIIVLYSSTGTSVRGARASHSSPSAAMSTLSCRQTRRPSRRFSPRFWKVCAGARLLSWDWKTIKPRVNYDSMCRVDEILSFQNTIVD